MKYMVVVEQGPTSWGAYVPDLLGCIAAGESRDEVVELIQEAIEFHLEGLGPVAVWPDAAPAAILPLDKAQCASCSRAP